MRSDLPSGTVTYLFTDVEGSTRLLHELDAEGYADALAEHRRVIREACASEGGVEVDTRGDAFFRHPPPNSRPHDRVHQSSHPGRQEPTRSHSLPQGYLARNLYRLLENPPVPT